MNENQRYSLCERIVIAYMKCDWEKANELERIYFGNPERRRKEALPSANQPYVSEGAITDISDLEEFDEDEMWGWDK